ncbi:hypothetical protein [Propioniciclava sinopodophylli]|uniref:hypothetical protein n=1 Tax=Propioniciclava sinopodophylli TaxID=1837344 RepID=UPI00248FEF37|nr:hypothetical protein [Propioniciclava sinopodophylli]
MVDNAIVAVTGDGAVTPRGDQAAGLGDQHGVARQEGGPAETGVVLQVDHGGVRVTPRGDDVVDRDVEVVGRAEHDHQRPSSGACSAPVAPLSVVSQYRP